MNENDELERVSSKELRDGAVLVRGPALDARCIWELTGLRPAAGELDEAETDVMR
jgi:hypothetical protein